MGNAALRTVQFVAILALELPAGVSAEEKAGRYSMMPSDGGFVRLDTETGVTTFCKQEVGSWKCDAMPDGQQKLRDDLARLEAENKALKAEMKQMEDVLSLSPQGSRGQFGDVPGAGAPMSPEAGPPAPKVQIPTEQDVDRMFDYIEGMVRKFKERIERMEKDPLAKPESAPPDQKRPSEGGSSSTPL